MPSNWGTSVVQVRIEGIDKLLRDAERLGVAAKDLSKFTRNLAWPIARRARALAPQGKTKNLRKGIRPVASKSGVRVRVGNKTRLPYAARRHWGDDGKSGPKWLSRAEEELRPQTIKGLADGINQLLAEYEWD